MTYLPSLGAVAPRFFSKNSWRLFSTIINAKPLEKELKENFGHTPVMSAEILKALRPKSNQVKYFENLNVVE